MTSRSIYILFALLASVYLTCPKAWAHDPNLNAIYEYNETLKKNPDDLEALKARGSTYRALEYHDSALEDLLHADRIDPDNPEVVAEIGMCHYHLGEWTAATEYLERAERLMVAKIAAGNWDPDEYTPVERELREYLFHNYIDLERYEEALAESDKLMQYLKGKLSFQCDVADVLLMMGRTSEAMPYYRMALEVSVSFERYVVGAANCLLRLDRIDEALELMEAWKAEDPDAVQPFLHEGAILRAYKKDDAAAAAALARGESMVRARIEGEEYPDIEDLTFLARILQNTGGYEEAFEIVNELMEDYRAHWLIPHLQAINARGLGRVNEAESYEKEARLYKRLNPSDWLQAYEILEPEPPPLEETLLEPKEETIFGKSWPYILLLFPVLLAVYLIRRRLK